MITELSAFPFIFIASIDFIPLPGSPLSLSATNQIQCTPVSILDDFTVELDETFSALLNSSSNEFVDVTQASSTVTITDDDTVSIGWTSTLYSASELDGAVSVCVNITGGEIARPITAFYSTVDGTALGNEAVFHAW